jgi:branched-subunit amino acid aminotransferase/4-amino-4-deoxychorismate lyase
MYHEKGFEIVSIGIETNEDRWKRAIERDQMNWPYHHSDLREFDGKLAQLFNVHSIPTTFLVNPEGDVVAVKPHPSEIGEILSTNL